MDRVARTLKKAIENSGKSLLLLGPRQTGKSTLIRSLRPDIEIDLSHEAEYLAFARNPRELDERLEARKVKTVFIDEVQRLPGLTNTVQHWIDRTDIRFFLTGSSARKLRRGKANLLPGRVLSYEMRPLTVEELNDEYPLRQVLETGLMPGIFTCEDPREREELLSAYAAIYLKEEIQSEALVKNIEGFSRFIFVAAACSGEFLDLSKLANQADIPRQSAVRFFEILEDTLIVRRLHAFAKTERRRLIKHPKYYFFDTGVLNGMLRNFSASADRAGKLFEHFVANQLFDIASNRRKPLQLSTFRTENDAEVDFIVEWDAEVFAIEVKASANVGKSDLTGFRSFSEVYRKRHRKMILTNGHVEKKMDDVFILPVSKGLKAIFG
ncbi:MAG: ATP-binding protein [Deltaproteobacteria bacterium]|nr:ATP-binding protein [Deltaproteobacteria bacterium]